MPENPQLYKLLIRETKGGLDLMATKSIICSIVFLPQKQYNSAFEKNSPIYNHLPKQIGCSQDVLATSMTNERLIMLPLHLLGS